MVFQSVRLQAAHIVAEFDCGEGVLDQWLRTSALTSDRMGTARTFVWADDHDRVVGFLSLCPHELRSNTLSGSLGRGSPAAIPSILLARLALDRTLHGDGLGAQLLFDALSRAGAAVQAAGGRFVVVDALHEEAAEFYMHHGFRRTTNPLRLVLKASDIPTAVTRA